MFRESAEDHSIRIQDLREIETPGLIVPFEKDLRKRETLLIQETEKE